MGKRPARPVRRPGSTLSCLPEPANRRPPPKSIRHPVTDGLRSAPAVRRPSSVGLPPVQMDGSRRSAGYESSAVAIRGRRAKGREAVPRSVQEGERPPKERRFPPRAAPGCRIAGTDEPHGPPPSSRLRQRRLARPLLGRYVLKTLTRRASPAEQPAVRGWHPHRCRSPRYMANCLCRRDLRVSLRRLPLRHLPCKPSSRGYDDAQDQRGARHRRGSSETRR